MIFNFWVLINLAVVNTIGSSNLSLNSYLLHPLPDNCTPFVEETIKHFDNCQVSERGAIIKYGTDAVPYVCLMSLDVAAELCKAPELLKKLDQLNGPKSVCPMSYALKSNNLKTNITKGVTYMSNEVNCKGVCEFNPNLSYICQFIALANEIITQGKSVGESLDHAKADDNQSVHLLEKDGTDGFTQGDGISQDTKLAQETKPKVSPKQVHEFVQTVTVNKSGIDKPDTKTEGVTVNKKTNVADLALNPDSEIKRPDGSTDINNSFKVMNDSNSTNVSGNKTVLKNGTSKNNDNYKIKPSEINKSQDLPSNKGNTDIPVTESQPPQPPLENDYSSKNQQSNLNIINKNNNNVNNNNNNMEFEDDSAVKTPHDEGEDDDDNNNEDMDKSALQDALLEGEPQFAKSVNQKEIYSRDNFFQAEDSHFSVYFLTTVSIIIVGYVIYHNKKKILAYALEGRRNKNGRRRPTSASYRKLDCNLEEAIASNPSNTSVTNVVY